MVLRRFFSIKSLGYAFEESKIEKVMRQLKSKDTIPFPWSFTGIEKREPNLRFIADRMFVVNKISFKTLLTSLWFQYEAFIKCLGEMDISPLKDQLEVRLYDSINITLGTLKQEDKYLKLIKDPDYTEEKPTINIIDSLVYRGLSIDRTQNKSIIDYHVYYDENLGIACFTDNALSDPMGYTNQALMEELHAKNRQTLLQLLVWIKSPYMIRLYQGDKDISEYRNYTYTQQCVFESQCLQPQWMKKEEKSESYMEWIGKFKPEKFIISDANDMLGINPLTTKRSN
ncbi:hypothetical protein SteCoe_23107 [Stentor coeruleus]|uniref:Uncharacterized protein n=1 Tax=Stentor coeruleus TaxID=5963 RepID=A0A1R2BKM6_9CILI|nr:hypothetical protein SteCoe_23107 [Stentor coeruleus]